MEEKKKKTRYPEIMFSREVEEYVKSLPTQSKDEIEEMFYAALDGKEGLEQYYRGKMKRDAAKDIPVVVEDTQPGVLDESEDLEPIIAVEQENKDIFLILIEKLREVYNPNKEFINKCIELAKRDEENGIPYNLLDIAQKLNATPKQETAVIKYIRLRSACSEIIIRRREDNSRRIA